MLVMTLLVSPKDECQRCVNNLNSSIFNNQTAVRQHSASIDMLAAFMGKTASDDIATTFWKCASTEQQWFLVLHLGYSMGIATALTTKYSISCLHGQKCYWRYHCHLLIMTINAASTIHGVAFWIIWGLWNGIDSQSTYQLPGWANILVKLSGLPTTIEHLWSINNFVGAQYATQLWNGLPSYKIEFYVVICHCIQLLQYACHVWQIWLCWFVALESILMNSDCTLP